MSAEAAPSPDDLIGVNAGVLATKRPLGSDVLLALASNPNASAIFADASNVYGLVAQGASVSDDSSFTTNSITLSSTADFSIDLSDLPSDENLIIALLDSAADGGGFDVLDFEVTVEGNLVVDEQFTDLAAALAFFNDNVIDLGALDVLVSDGILDIVFDMDLTSNDPGDGFRYDLAFGNAIPEPSTALLLALGLVALAHRRRASRG